MGGGPVMQQRSVAQRLAPGAGWSWLTLSRNFHVPTQKDIEMIGETH
jgi:hypothetical protein